MKIEKSCKEAIRLDKIGSNTIWHSYKFNQLSQDCLQSPTAISSKDLVKKLSIQTRRCNLETVTSQIVCKEIKVKGEEISEKEYSLLKKKNLSISDFKEMFAHYFTNMSAKIAHFI